MRIFFKFRYRRLSIPENPARCVSSNHRTKRIEHYGKLDSIKKLRGRILINTALSVFSVFVWGIISLVEVLGDTTDKDYPIFRTPRKTDPGATVATGDPWISEFFSYPRHISQVVIFSAVFDLVNRKLNVYTGNPSDMSISPIFEGKLWIKIQKLFCIV